MRQREAHGLELERVQGARRSEPMGLRVHVYPVFHLPASLDAGLLG